MSAPSFGTDVETPLWALRHIVALRRAGLTSAAALGIVERAVPPSRFRNELSFAASVLSGGTGGPAPVSLSPVALALSRGDAVSADELGALITELTRLHELDDVVEHGARRVAVAAGAIAAIVVLLGGFGVSTEMMLARPPLVYELVTVLRLPAACAFVAVAVIAWRNQLPWTFRRFRDGARRLRALAALSRSGRADESAAAAADVAKEVSPAWGAFAARVAQRQQPTDVAATLATTIERGVVARAVRRLRAYVIVVTVVGVLFVALSLVGIYSPLFTIAGSVG